MQFDGEALSGRRYEARLGCSEGVIGRIDEKRHCLCVRDKLMQQFQPLRRNFYAQLGHARYVAARPAEARNKAKLDRVGAQFKDDRDGCGRCLRRKRARVVVAAITATWRRTRSAANAGNRSF
jgi:hypothetical protein